MNIYDNIKQAWFNTPEVELKPTSSIPYRPKESNVVVVMWG